MKGDRPSARHRRTTGATPAGNRAANASASHPKRRPICDRPPVSLKAQRPPSHCAAKRQPPKDAANCGRCQDRRQRRKPPLNPRPSAPLNAIGAVNRVTPSASSAACQPPRWPQQCPTIAVNRAVKAAANVSVSRSRRCLSCARHPAPSRWHRHPSRCAAKRRPSNNAASHGRCRPRSPPHSPCRTVNHAVKCVKSSARNGPRHRPWRPRCHPRCHPRWQRQPCRNARKCHARHRKSACRPRFAKWPRRRWRHRAWRPRGHHHPRQRRRPQPPPLPPNGVAAAATTRSARGVDSA